MAIEKVGVEEMEGGFLQVYNKIICDKNLSDQALGMLIRLMSLPEWWEFNYNGYAMVYPKSGKSRIASTMKELINLGYVKNKKPRDNKGHYLKGVLTIIYNPYPENPDMENPIMDSPDIEKSALEYREKGGLGQ